MIGKVGPLVMDLSKEFLDFVLFTFKNTCFYEY